jgi:hypothetical protein
MRFWDSSALLPLIVAQHASSDCDQWFASDAAIAIWTLTPVEVSLLHTLDARLAGAARREGFEVPPTE